ncbi:MAG: sugar ABC transporter ATP-binding protein [Anaerolineae bacterium]|nr:sugar ABC transporter ATP-binding protein [Anaerolineae bacterium]
MNQLQPLVSLDGISKAFGGVQALKGVHFEIYPGEVHALLGENGAGKSTLIKIITGVHQPDQGEILLDGKPVRLADPRQARSSAIAAIYQEPNLFPDLDIAENIFVGRQPKQGKRVDWQEMYREASKLVHSLGLNLDVKTKARSLSVAQQQMVEIARALSLNARVLIMDEPTSSLTLSEVAELFTIVRHLRETGTAIVFISHRLDEIFQIADRVTTLRDGIYVDTRMVADVTREDLVQMMVGRTLSSLFPKHDVHAGDTVLEVEHLAGEGIFNDISFELKAGEILGIYGLIGAGRTEIARALFGIEPATGGRIKINGREVSIKSPQDAMDLGVGFVPEDRQMHGLILQMPIAQNITLPILQHFVSGFWLDRNKESSTAHDLVRRLRVKTAGVWQLARELSGGNQQKVVLSKWLGTNPRILILDEPTRGIDVGSKSEVHQLLSQLASEGIAIIMISSELPEILGMSDRILVIREGGLGGEFAQAEATQEKLMHAVTTIRPA